LEVPGGGPPHAYVTTRFGEIRSGAQIRLERWFGVQRREAVACFVSGWTDLWHRPAGRTCSTVTQWRKLKQLIEAKTDGRASHGCTESVLL